MARKKNNNYFELMEQQVSFCVKAARLLEEFLSGYTVENILAQKQKMHEIENQADELHHDIHARLAAEFITPIDQEDILQLVQIVDDITDAIDEVVLYFYMYGMTEVPVDAPAAAKIVSRCVDALYEAVKELRNFKKPDKLRKLLVDVNSIESEADAAYIEAIHNLFARCPDTKQLIGSTAIYERLESCCDLCEHASDVIDRVVMKNT